MNSFPIVWKAEKRSAMEAVVIMNPMINCMLIVRAAGEGTNLESYSDLFVMDDSGVGIGE